eukprot:1851614-Rhodomonas_salina.1
MRGQLFIEGHQGPAPELLMNPTSRNHQGYKQHVLLAAAVQAYAYAYFRRRRGAEVRLSQMVEEAYNRVGAEMPRVASPIMPRARDFDIGIDARLPRPAVPQQVGRWLIVDCRNG